VTNTQTGLAKSGNFLSKELKANKEIKRIASHLRKKK
jgi:hypothetical protein